MGRSPFARNNALWMSIVAALVGALLTVLAFTASYSGAPDGWNAFYEERVPCPEGEGCWNLAVKVLAPVVLVTGLWYLGEQIIARRKFERLIDEKKKSEFQKNIDELEETIKKLPKSYEDRYDEKTEQFSSRR